MIRVIHFIDPPLDGPENEMSDHAGWNLRPHTYDTLAIECMHLGSGLDKQEFSLKDVTRCVIPNIGILGKYHPGNRNRILQRTMLRLEHQVRTWNEGDTSDHQKLKISDKFHQRGAY